jgi:hypothetical protein
MSTVEDDRAGAESGDAARHGTRGRRLFSEALLLQEVVKRMLVWVSGVDRADWRDRRSAAIVPQPSVDRSERNAFPTIPLRPRSGCRVRAAASRSEVLPRSRPLR